MTAVEQPSGEVTLVFSDIEGSTKLLAELGTDAYREALREHRRIVREAYASYSGYEVDYEGDAFFYTFASAPDAVSAVSEAMAGLAGGRISIRVGIHTGTPELDPPKYVGMDVHFAARVMSSAHGGQVVVSRATAELVETKLVSLGSHRLKDIAEPVSLYQLGDGSFPPLKTIANSNLPTPVSSFLGRQEELREADLLLQETRLLTIHGPGGQGKTRFALELATRAREERFSDYPDGVFACFLASLRDPSLVLPAIAQTLSVREQPGQRALDALSAFLQKRELLLLLDNAEHLLECAPELSQLLSACPNLTLLVTSRELLRISGEETYALPRLPETEGIALFCERSKLVPSPQIAQIAERLEGLPLAIELAAARTRILSPAQLLERLGSRLDLLKGGRDADPRQQTLRATIEWSYDLLSPEEQELLARLSVFAGGCTLEATEEVCDADLDSLQSLVDKSLLRFNEERFWMLETIREYAGERLEESGMANDARSRHVRWLLDQTASADDRLQTATAATTLEWLAREMDNIRAAFAWMDHERDAGLQLELIERIWRYWVIRGALAEGLRCVESALEGTTLERTLRRAICLRVAAVLTRSLGDLARARTYAEQSLTLRRELGDPQEIAHGLSALAVVAADEGRYLEAERLYEEAGALGRGSETHTRAMLTGSLADLAMRQGDYERAIHLAGESLALFRQFDRDDGACWTLFTIALSLFWSDRTDECVAPTRESLLLAHARLEVETIVWDMILVSAIAERRSELRTGVRLLAAANALRVRSELTLTGAEARLHEETTQRLGRALGAVSFEEGVAEGQSLSLDEAVEYALASVD